MKDMDEASYIFGIKNYRDRSRNLVVLSQEMYIKKILKHFHMKNYKTLDTPMEKGVYLSLKVCSKNPKEKKK